MRTSVERLRLGLLVGAGLLLLVIAGFLGYARYHLRRGLVDLPGKLGATITKEFNGYTYSQSDGKRTVFTLHAAKASQHQDGRIGLRDVNMVLYGKKGDRADHISGENFEYDTKAEVVRAIGIVHIDLEAPAAQGPPDGEARKHLAGAAAAGSAKPTLGGSNRLVHVTTSGLVYIKNLGIAATDQGVDFAFGGFTGHAVGAEYNSDTGHLVLQSAVTVNGIDKGRPVAMNATHGELDRATNLAEFTDAHYSSAGETAQARNGRLHMRPDGSLERIEGDGHVVLAEAGQGTATSDRADVSLDTANKPKTVVLTGNVHFAEDEPIRQVRGESDVANLDFDTQGHLDHALLHSHVRTSERLPGPEPSTQPWQARTLTADDLDLRLAAASHGENLLLRDAKATGSAHLTTVATVSEPASQKVCGELPVASGRCSVTTTSKLSGDMILAHLVAPRGVAELSTVHGTGHTVVERHTSAGVDQISTGETLDASFREMPGPDPAKAAVELATTVQQGGVAITRTLPHKDKAGATTEPDIQHATARKASYDADAGTFALTGDARMSETGSTLTADRVIMERDSQNATADGTIKVTYLQARQIGSQQIGCQQTSSAEPVHILAAHADLNHDAGRATFYGRPAAGGPVNNSGLARLWQAATQGRNGALGAQGGSQVEAPVLVFEQEQRRLTARSERPGVAGQVHAALADTEGAKHADGSEKSGDKSASEQPAKGETSRRGIARITSSQMVYSDLDRQAVFTGGVRLLDGDDNIRAQQATVYLTPVSAGKDASLKEGEPAMSNSTNAANKEPCSKGTGSVGVGSSGTDSSGTGSGDPGTLEGATGLLGGDIERIVATEHVEMTQPGRRATGDRLVYTASEQMYVLTGTPAVPPKVVDANQGSTTGASLSFHKGEDKDDNNVVVSGRDGDAPAQKVHTETRIKQ